MCTPENLLDISGSNAPLYFPHRTQLRKGWSLGHVNIIRQRKLERIGTGLAPRVLDLFAGCGGLSLGFRAAGFQIAGAVELDAIAASSHALNFHGEPDGLRTLHAQARDITCIEPGQLIEEFGYGEKANAIDVIVGGPPCQSFARVGRAKLREVDAHPEAFRMDPRGDLYLRYLQYVRELQPLVVLVENVPDVINYGGHNIPEEICEVLSDLGYVCGYTLLNVAFYGVPQMRERMFLLAYAQELETDIRFPKPSRWIDLPRGYEGSRQVALKTLKPSLFNADTFYVQPPPSNPGLPPATTAMEAIGDLPLITAHLDGHMPRGARRFDTQVPYSASTPTPYARMMRCWPDFQANGGISDHVIRSLPRDYPIFRRMRPGDQYPEAYRHALCLFEEHLADLEREGKALETGSQEYLQLKRKMVPPYDSGKFPNKWRKMEANQPARTLMAHLGKDGYSHIHYDSEQARTISVREAARLQSFPDGFRFMGTMNPAFRQIGNAVPPLMAYALAMSVSRALSLPAPQPLFAGDFYAPDPASAAV